MLTWVSCAPSHYLYRAEQDMEPHGGVNVPPLPKNWFGRSAYPDTVPRVELTLK